MFTTLLHSPYNTYNLQTSKTFSIHNTSTSLSHSHPTSTTWTKTAGDIILTKIDKNMGWSLVSTTWFSNEYTRQLTDSTTDKRINNFDLNKTITDSNKLLRKLQIRFNNLLTTSTDKQLLNASRTNCNYLTWNCYLKYINWLILPRPQTLTS